jgi:uncharacterized membrane protein YidH (DUF202 family)
VTRAQERRWSKVVDPGLQQERTALAWERTAVSLMVAGTLLARYAADASHWTTALAGIAEVVVGAVILVWAEVHYVDLRGPIVAGAGVVHPTATRVVGLAAIGFTGFALLLALIDTAA